METCWIYKQSNYFNSKKKLKIEISFELPFSIRSKCSHVANRWRPRRRYLVINVFSLSLLIPFDSWSRETINSHLEGIKISRCSSCFDVAKAGKETVREAKKMKQINNIYFLLSKCRVARTHTHKPLTFTRTQKESERERGSAAREQQIRGWQKGRGCKIMINGKANTIIFKTHCP